MSRGKTFWTCLDCGHQVHDGTIPEATLTAPTSGDLDSLPNVLALPWWEYRRETHPVMRLHRLCDVAEILTRLLTIITLGEARRSTPDATLPEDILNFLRSHIERPTFGTWRNMLKSLATHLPRDPVLPELRDFVVNEMFPRMESQDAHGEEESCRKNIVAMRNAAVHGGPLSRNAAKEYLMAWEPWLEGLRPGIAFLDAAAGRPGSSAIYLVGESGIQHLLGLAPPKLVAKEDLADLLLPLGHVVLVRGTGWVDLWPLVDYGTAVTHTIEGMRRSSDCSPQVYFRGEPDRLLYAALAGDVPIGERSDVLDSFQKLFRIQERINTAPPDDYEREIAADSESLVGRKKEIEQAKAEIKETQQGVLWISGPGGIGKSFIIARLAQDLRGDSRKTCRIVWRFQSSDQRRCNRLAFLQHAVTRLSSWLWEKKAISEIELPERDPAKLEKQFTELLDRAAALPAPSSTGRPPRVLIVLDGLDEIARQDLSFANRLFELQRPNIVWLCAGRAESGLEDIFTPDRSRHIFEGGLPPMTPDDIRAMLLEGSGLLKYEFLAMDRETGQP